jgi:hypothetical protein
LFEKIETRIALESENNAKMKLNLLLENQIKSKRQTLYCQDVVGPILKNLFDSGIREIDIVAMKGISDLFLNFTGNDVRKLNVKQEEENLKRAINLILNAANFKELQNYTDRLNLNEFSFSSFLSMNRSANGNGNDRN